MAFRDTVTPPIFLFPLLPFHTPYTFMSTSKKLIRLGSDGRMGCGGIHGRGGWWFRYMEDGFLLVIPTRLEGGILGRWEMDGP